MDLRLKEQFLAGWTKYFSGAELPITFYYTNEEGRAELQPKPAASSHGLPRCVIGQLARVRQGQPIALSVDSVGCFGGKRFLGFKQDVPPNFEYFLSCGIPGKLEGERYKRTPELVNQTLKRAPAIKAPGRFVVFKRWDQLEELDRPEVVIFFAPPDVLAGLFTLTYYDSVDPDAVICPMGSGCSSIVQNPYLEKDSSHPRAVLGMFDVSARPFVPPQMLTFALPMKRFEALVGYMDESFLITEAWGHVRNRLDRTAEYVPMPATERVSDVLRSPDRGRNRADHGRQRRDPHGCLNAGE
jgi:hypothetical protein